MADRSEQLASTIDRQANDLDQVLAGLTDSDLELPCADPGGATVGEVLSHLGEGSGMVLGWLDLVASGAPAGDQDSAGTQGHAGHGHGHDAGAGSVRGHAERLRQGGETWSELVRGLSDEQLDQVPAAAENITDGTTTLAGIMALMIDHQSAHLDYIKTAVTGLAGPAERAS